MDFSVFKSYDLLQDAIVIIELDTLKIVWMNQAGISRFGQINADERCFEYLYGVKAPCAHCKKEEYSKNFSKLRNQGLPNYSEDHTIFYIYKNKKVLTEIDGKKYMIVTFYDEEKPEKESGTNFEGKQLYETLLSEVNRINLSKPILEQMQEMICIIKKLFEARKVSIREYRNSEEIKEPIIVQDEDFQGVQDYAFLSNVIEQEPKYKHQLQTNHFIELSLQELITKFPNEFSQFKTSSYMNYLIMVWNIDDYWYHLIIENYKLSYKDKGIYDVMHNYLSFILRSFIYHRALYNLGNKDLLTGLSSRNKYNVDITERYTKIHKNLGVAFIDLDRLKEVNDSFGHEVGDKLLRSTADILTSAFTTGEIYRIGGDEFVVICTDSSKKEFEESLQKFEKDATTAEIFYSCGYCYQNNHTSITDLITKAEKKMYASKREHHCENVINSEQKAFIDKFYEDVHKGNYFIVLQPKFNPQTGKLEGAEALIRGYNPLHEVIYPHTFIPSFEKYNCMDVLDYYMIEEICKLQKHIIEHQKTTIPISINISKNSLFLNSLEEDIIKLVNQYDIPRNVIHLELAEKLNITTEELEHFSNKLNLQGIKLELADFGLHFYNLGFLSDDVFSIVKIASSIVNKLAHDSVSMRIMEFIIKECHEKNVIVLAEGVESEEELEAIKKIKVDLAQGFYFEKPMQIKEFLGKYIYKKTF
ncbi:MAG: EAL domain-containing protein [Anaeroplasmataceae bacterium]|nr:EAL domain-containing protein [Anaeroplasmataceae bacterium]